MEQEQIITIRLPKKTIEIIEKLAKENERNRSQQIRFMLDKYIKIISE